MARQITTFQEWLNIDQAAEYLGVSRRSILNAIQLCKCNIANVDLKLLTSGGTMLREDAFNVDAPTAVNYTSDTWTTYIDGGATSTWDTTVVNDMRLQVKHAGNVSGTPTFLADYAFVRVVYTETVIPPTVKLTSGKIIITNGKVSV